MTRFPVEDSPRGGETEPHEARMVQSATASTIELDPRDKAPTNAYILSWITFIEGTGKGHWHEIASYDGPTNTAGVRRPMAIMPDRTTAYILDPPYTDRSKRPGEPYGRERDPGPQG